MNLTQSELQILAEDNQRLKEENERLISDRSIWEKKARELGMKNPDDEIFKFKKTED
jgi:cell division protein FtsB